MITNQEISELNNYDYIDVSNVVNDFRKRGYKGKINLHLSGKSVEWNNSDQLIKDKINGTEYVISPYGMINKNWVIPAEEGYSEASGKFKKAWQKSKKYNPLLVTARGGVLAGMRLNIFALSVRLYPAFLTKEEAKKKKIKVEAIEPAKKAWERVSKFFIKIGGDPKSLKKAITKGYNKPIFKWTKAAKQRTSSFEGYLVPSQLGSGERLEEWFESVTGADDFMLISSGIGLLTSILTMVNKAGAMKNPYEQSRPDLEEADKDAPKEDESEVKKLEELAKEDAAKGLKLDSDDDDEIFGINKTYFWIGVGVLALVGGFLVYKKLKK